MATLFHVSWTLVSFFGSLHSKPLHGLELISFLTITGSNTFSVSWTYKYFIGSLLSIPLHRLELISFSAHLAISVAMATLFLFLGLKSLSQCSLHSKPLHGLVLISFSMMPGKTFFLFLTYKYFYGFLVFHTPAQIGAD